MGNRTTVNIITTNLLPANMTRIRRMNRNLRDD
jgi:hypothetical protein